MPAAHQPRRSPVGHAARPDGQKPVPNRELKHGAAADLDKRTLIRLRRGQMPIDGMVDLHGHTQEQAHRLLESFLAASCLGGRRCVLIITGKGTRSEGVLRAAVPHWLNQPPNRERILAFCHAGPTHGGEGALYVLLKRRRPPHSR